MRSVFVGLLLASTLLLQGCALLFGPRTVVRMIDWVATETRTDLQFARVDLLNEAGKPIFRVFARPCGTEEWGEDRLGTRVIQPGTRHRIVLEPGCWDLEARSQDGATTGRQGQPMEVGMTYTWLISPF